MGLPAANGFKGSRPILLYYRRVIGFFKILIIALKLLIFGLNYFFPIRADFRNKTLFYAYIIDTGTWEWWQPGPGVTGSRVDKLK